MASGRPKDVTFVVPKKPRGMPRPRARCGGGRAFLYNSKEALALLASIRKAYIETAGEHEPWRGPVRLVLRAEFAPLTKWRAAVRRAAAALHIPHTSKPDVDNILKAVMDALTELAYEDDSQVFEVVATSEFSGRAQTEVRVEFWDVVDDASLVERLTGLEREGAQ